MQRFFSGLPALYTATALLAVNGVLCKAIALDAMTITCLRCFIAAVPLLLLTTLSQRPWGFTSTSSKLALVVSGILMGAHWSSFFYAMQISSVAIGILAHYSAPVVTVILEPLLDKKRPQLADLCAGGLVILGLALMVPRWSLDSEVVQGIGFGLISALTFASRNLVQRRWMRTESGAQGMSAQVCIAALITLPFAEFEPSWQLPALQWGYVLALGLVSTALSHTLIVISLQTLSAKSVSLISCFQPPLAIALSWLFLAEIPSMATALGGCLILCCAFYEAYKTRQ